MLLAPQKASFSAPEAGYVQVARAFRPRNERMKIGVMKPPLPRARPHEPDGIRSIWMTFSGHATGCSALSFQGRPQLWGCKIQESAQLEWQDAVRQIQQVNW